MRAHEETDKNQRWFVEKFPIHLRELVMSFLVNDYCTAQDIMDLEVELHHPNLHSAIILRHKYTH